MLKLLNSDNIFERAITRYLALSESKQKQFKESLDNDKTLLKSENQIYDYLYHCGEMHRQKLLRAFAGLPVGTFNGNLSVISFQKHIYEWKEDYSCQI